MDKEGISKAYIIDLSRNEDIDIFLSGHQNSKGTEENL